MASLITPQFEQYIAQQTIAKSTVVFDEFVFANIPGLTADNLKNHLTMPHASQIVHRQAVSQSGVVNENAVVYSVTIGTEVGDFDFNFIGLVNKSKNMLAVAIQTTTIKKVRNKNNVQGNSITRNVLLEFRSAQALTNINVTAQTWQIDFTVRLHGIDENIRLTNRDLYGRAVFFDDSFLVKRGTGNNYTIAPGVAYVEGVRANMSALENITAASLPCSIYLDVVHHCTVTGAYETELKFLKVSKADYTDSTNRPHYVQILADIDSNGTVTDRRLLSPFLGINPLDLDDTTINKADKSGHTHKLSIASLVKRGIVKLYSGSDSDSEQLAATPKAVKTAYDKAVEAKNAADNAKKTADGKQSPATTLEGYGITDAIKYGGRFKGNISDLRENVVVELIENETIGLPDNVYKYGMLMTQKGPSGLAQIYVSHSNGDVVTRGGWDGVWEQWVRLDGKDNVNKNGGTMTGTLSVPNIITKHNGTGGYHNQFDMQAPFFVDAVDYTREFTFHPFVKGKVRTKGDWGASFSIGYTTKQTGYYETGEFGRGVINLNEDNGKFFNWEFEHNGTFRSAGDVITSTGRSLNSTIYKEGNPNDIALSWLSDGLKVRVDVTDLGRVAFKHDIRNEKLIWEGNTSSELTVDIGVDKGLLMILTNNRGYLLWYTLSIQHCNNTIVGFTEFGGENADKDRSSWRTVKRSGTSITFGNGIELRKIILLGG
ncbi:phage tail-collar fiber domain-containing protein [Aggregatibacter actinomycetemcomitans]|uniref:phage tail-collar fiber domain-containing protein n=1 Tax=Aggregatibacter actinomycetemcomitans TaxID=714 RepID=UPI001F11F258|nr:phage tail protein [Aggregatibacter actinomycetemcomitans]